jgi:hypothetical protein
MKKIFLGLTVIAAISLSSCKKDIVCTCTESSTYPGTTSSTVDVTAVKAKKGDVKKACVKTTTDFTVGGTTYTNTRDCKIK